MSNAGALVLALACAMGLVGAGAAAARLHRLFGNVVGGYDPVAYFTRGTPMRGDARFAYKWNGAEFRFASAASRDAFRANPARYAPQYGGYRAWAIAHGYTASGDPKVWRIADGRLYLNYNAAIGRAWSKDIPRYILAADRNCRMS